MLGFNNSVIPRISSHSIRIVGASACVIFILHQKIQKMVKCTFCYQLTQQSPESHKMVVCVYYHHLQQRFGGFLPPLV